MNIPLAIGREEDLSRPTRARAPPPAPHPPSRHDLDGPGLRSGAGGGLAWAALWSGDGVAGVFGEGARDALAPWGRRAGGARGAGLSPRGGPRGAPEGWPRRDDAEAVFLNTRGSRLS